MKNVTTSLKSYLVAIEVMERKRNFLSVQRFLLFVHRLLQCF